MWISRQHIAKIERAINSRPAVLLTGVRQSGKSSLLKKLLPQAEYVTLDRVALAEEAEINPTRFLKKFNKQTIIDEVQYAPSLFRDLKSLIDENRSLKGKWILTGSQQFALMSGVHESLAGRIRIIHLGTLSANELNATNLIKKKRDLIWKGGFPEIWAEKLDAEEFFEDYIQTYLERDLKDVLNITNLRDFRRLLSLLALRCGQLLNFSTLAKDIGVSVNTIKSWVSALEASGLVILLPPYYNNLGKRLIKAPKLYFCDSGLAAALLNINSLKTLDNSTHSGHLWENFVFAEFIKEGFIAGKNLFYYRDQNSVEIDFIVEKDGQTHLIEAKESERPDRKKLNFKKVAKLFSEDVKCILACGIEEKGRLDLTDFSVYNPLYGFSLFDKKN
ncbi:ATP-binding protein [Carboxylicivirga sp. N1Y90]|uniref:ATP-binding protein n=1 Tax=Carboxylicivirga fragile TaxID=3417571 RepID=UPI003D339FE2|nr:ATP-binding protein [Marinilabiliaceae bacterium N1Y90]